MFASLTNLSISSLTELLVEIFPPVHTGCKKIHFSPTLTLKWDVRAAGETETSRLGSPWPAQ